MTMMIIIIIIIIIATPIIDLKSRQNPWPLPYGGLSRLMHALHYTKSPMAHVH
jgi:hypothetical protein